MGPARGRSPASSFRSPIILRRRPTPPPPPPLPAPAAGCGVARTGRTRLQPRRAMSSTIAPGPSGRERCRPGPVLRHRSWSQRPGAVPPGRVALGSGPGGPSPPPLRPAAHAVGSCATRPSPVALGGSGTHFVQRHSRGSAGSYRSAPGHGGSPGLRTVCWIAGAYRRGRPCASRRGRAAGRFRGQGCRE